MVFFVLLFYLLLVPLIALLKLIVRAKSIEKRRIDPALVDLHVRDFFAVQELFMHKFYVLSNKRLILSEIGILNEPNGI